MPLTAKGKKIMKAMVKTYGGKEKASQVFYAMVEEKKLKGVHHKPRKSKA